MTSNWRILNQANWDERATIHASPRGYDLSSHRAGRGDLDAIIAADLGPVTGLRILHLQCHIGHDTVALAQSGAAEVIGVDFSPASLELARALAIETGARQVSFVESDVQQSALALPDQRASFDLVFTTWGTICWLGDLSAWAETVAFFLKPGGALYFADAHPVALVFDDLGDPVDPDGRPKWYVPYFDRSGRVFDEVSDYADPEARLTNSKTIQWMHPLADILGALRGAGLTLEWLREHPRVTWRMFPGLVRDGDGLWTWPRQPWLPLAISLRAVKT
jgi:SAM-dependent methyltransferase